MGKWCLKPSSFFLIRSSSNLLVTRTGIKSRTSSNSCQIGSVISELHALEGELNIQIFKRKKRAVKRSNTSLKDLPKVLEDHGRHSMLSFSFLSSQPISVLRILDTEANKFYDRNHQLYDAALLTRCYTEHALLPLSILKQITNDIS